MNKRSRSSSFIIPILIQYMKNLQTHKLPGQNSKVSPSGKGLREGRLPSQYLKNWLVPPRSFPHFFDPQLPIFVIFTQFLAILPKLSPSTSQPYLGKPATYCLSLYPLTPIVDTPVCNNIDNSIQKMQQYANYSMQQQ